MVLYLFLESLRIGFEGNGKTIQTFGDKKELTPIVHLYY